MHAHQDWPEQENHRAHVDDAGHIYLGEKVEKEIEYDTVPRNSPVLRRSAAQWEITDDDPMIQEIRFEQPGFDYCEQLITILKTVRGSLVGTTQEFLCEGKQQYIHSFRGFRFGIHDVKIGVGSGLHHIWSVLTQPVWIMRNNKQSKEYKRGTLFLFDVVRFGGTFAGIFVALFVSLNYQSFYEIITPYLDPVERLAAQEGNAAGIDNTLKEKLLKSPLLATAGGDEGNMLSYLPMVGPPENRLIIPKLGLNIPLVTPSYSSLLKEDWEGVETDIQDALQQGVVHYPGTARPGQAGNFFVTGHSSYYPWATGKFKTVFARLHELSVGDEYWVYYGGDKHRYVIQGKKEVKPSDVTVLDQPSNKRTGTLMTCTPIGTTLRRLILVAQEIDIVTGIALEVGQQETRDTPAIQPGALPI